MQIFTLRLCCRVLVLTSWWTVFIYYLSRAHIHTHTNTRPIHYFHLQEFEMFNWNTKRLFRALNQSNCIGNLWQQHIFHTNCIGVFCKTLLIVLCSSKLIEVEFVCWIGMEYIAQTLIPFRKTKNCVPKGAEVNPILAHFMFAWLEACLFD